MSSQCEYVLAALECDGLTFDEVFSWWMSIWLIGNNHIDIEWPSRHWKMIYPGPYKGHFNYYDMGSV